MKYPLKRQSNPIFFASFAILAVKESTAKCAKIAKVTQGENIRFMAVRGISRVRKFDFNNN